LHDAAYRPSLPRVLAESRSLRREPMRVGRSFVVPSLVVLGLSAVCPALAADAPAGTLTIGVHVTLVNRWLDPGETEGLITPFMLLYVLHDALVKPMPGNINAPSLAESWSLSKDGLTYEFVLRKNAKFHNGDPVTADDVKFTFERYKGSGAKLLKERVKDVQVVAPNRVRFVLKEQWPDFMAFYGTSATGAGWIVPKKYLEKVGEDGFRKAPVGAGPFKFVSFNPGVELVLEAFPEYWRKAPHVKRIVMRSIPDESTRAAALKTGEVDLAYLFGGPIATELRKSPGLRVVAPMLYGVYWLDFLDQWDPKSPWHDQRVRLAASVAMDRRAINEVEMLGLGRTTGSFVPPEFDFSLKIDPPAYDPKRAKQLLAEAGYPNGFDAGDLTPLPPYTSLAEEVANYLQAGHFPLGLAGEEAARSPDRRHRRGGERRGSARTLRHEDRDLRVRDLPRPRGLVPASGKRAGQKAEGGAAASAAEGGRGPGAHRAHLPAGLPLRRQVARRGSRRRAHPGLPVFRAGRGPQGEAVTRPKEIEPH
jgi:peptide/nickel transport system substrate-binding protein